jgi:metallophosphoesterase superfamily enzyme
VRANVDGALLKKSLLRHYDIKQPLHQQTKLTQCIIMPSFNDFLGGRPINRKTKTTDSKFQILSPLLRSKSMKIEEAELFLLDGTFLGTIDQLAMLS